MKKGTIVGKGREAEVIAWDDGYVLKLFYNIVSRQRIEYEFKVNILVQKVFDNCPKAFKIIEENERIGILFEFIEGKNLGEVGGKNIFKLVKLVKLVAKLHAELHKHKINNLNLQKDVYTRSIQRTPLLNKLEKMKIIKYLERISEGNTICHSDFHPENIIISQSKLYIIDWANTTLGNPNGDVARTYYLLKYGMGPDDVELIEKSVFHKLIFRLFKKILSKVYLKQYIKLTSSSLENIKEWDIIIYAARLNEDIEEEQEILLNLIHQRLKNLDF
ncbi:MAG: phosphotransferase [Promethearchaeota archaeon]